MPQNHSCNRPVWSPVICDLKQIFLANRSIKFFNLFQCIYHRKIAYWKDICPLQGEKQVDIYCPVSNTFNLL